MNYLFFSTGPLHFIHIFEYIKKNRIKNYEIFIFKSKSERVNSEMLNTIKFLNLKNIRTVCWSTFKIMRIFQYISFINKLKFRISNAEFTFVISDFKYLFYHLLRINFKLSDFILIDEGTGTLIAYKKYISRGIFFPINQYDNYFLSMYKRLFTNNFRILLYSRFKIYSIFCNFINDKNTIVNNFEYIKKKVNKNFNKDNSIVMFIGTKLSERGFITISEELKILEKINLYWNKRGKKLIYVAKRTSSEKKLNLIKQRLSIDYIKFNLPLELAIGHEYKKLPYAICSHGSTLDITLKMIYKIKTYLFFPKGYEKMIHLDHSNNHIIVSKSEIINI